MFYTYCLYVGNNLLIINCALTSLNFVILRISQFSLFYNSTLITSRHFLLTHSLTVPPLRSWEIIPYLSHSSVANPQSHMYDIFYMYIPPTLWSWKYRGIPFTVYDPDDTDFQDVLPENSFWYFGCIKDIIGMQ